MHPLPRRHLLDGRISTERIAGGEADQEDIDLLDSVARRCRTNACAPWENSPSWRSFPALSISAQILKTHQVRSNQSNMAVQVMYA